MILMMYFGMTHTYIKAIFMIPIMTDPQTGDQGGMFPFPLVIDGVGLDGEVIIGIDIAMEVTAITILGVMTLGIMIAMGILHIMQIVEMLSFMVIG